MPRFPMTPKSKRYARIAAVVLAVLIVLFVIGSHFAAMALKEQVAQALGPTGEVREMSVGLTAIELRGVRIRAPQGWPAADTLRAERVTVVPDLLGLLTAKVAGAAHTIESAYLSILRTREGRVRLVPSLLESGAGKNDKAAKKDPGGVMVTVSNIELRDGVVEFFDASIRQPAHKLRLEKINADVGNLSLPGLGGRTSLAAEGTVKGVQRDGKLNLGGWLELVDKNSQLNTKLRGVDMVAFQPYLLKSAETGVRKGTLDLDLSAEVRRNIMHAPGSLTLSSLELEPGGGPLETFMGMPRSAILFALKNKDNQIKVQFALDGDLGDPQFSLNGSFLKQIGSTIAKTLGISIEGLVRGVGEAPGGITDALKGLFNKK